MQMRWHPCAFAILASAAEKCRCKLTDPVHRDGRQQAAFRPRGLPLTPATTEVRRIGTAFPRVGPARPTEKPSWRTYPVPKVTPRRRKHRCRHSPASPRGALFRP